MSTGQIGIKTANGDFYPILSAEAGVSQKRLVLTTVRDEQTTVQIDLYQSQDEDSTAPGPYIGSLIVENIAPAASGEPDINLTVGIDADGNLNSTATDTASGAYQSLSVGLESLAEDKVFEVPDFALDEERLDEEQFEDKEVEEAFDDIGSGDFDESEYEASDERLEDEAAPVGPVRPGPLLMAGFLVISLALVGLLTYLVFLVLQTPPAPPLEAASVSLFLLPTRIGRLFRRKKRIRRGDRIG